MVVYDRLLTVILTNKCAVNSLVLSAYLQGQIISFWYIFFTHVHVLLK